MAIPISNNKIPPIINIGINPARAFKMLKGLLNVIEDNELKILTEKLAIMFNKVCPDIIFAKSRIDKARETYDIISITIKRGAKKIGAPLGKNSFKK